MILHKEHHPVLYLSLAILLIGVQVGIVLSLLTLILPPLPVPQDLHLFIKHREGITTEYEMLFYRAAIMVTLVVAVIGWFINRRRLQTGDLIVALQRFSILTVGWLVVQAFAIFKLFLPNPVFIIKCLLATGLIGQMLTWVFFTELNNLINRQAHVKDIVRRIRIYPYGVDVFAIVTLIILLHQPLLILFYCCGYVLLRIIFQRTVLAWGMIILAIKWGLYHWLPDKVILLGEAPLFLSMAFVLIYFPARYKMFQKIAMIVLSILLFVSIYYQTWALTDTSILFPLRFRHFGAFLMSFIVPVVYMGVSLWGIVNWKDNRCRLIGLLAMYGLVEYVRYLCNPVITSFYGSGCVWAMVVGLLLNEIIIRWLSQWRIWLECVLVFLSIIFLLTNRLWLGVT